MATIKDWTEKEMQEVLGQAENSLVILHNRMKEMIRELPGPFTDSQKRDLRDIATAAKCAEELNDINYGIMHGEIQISLEKENASRCDRPKKGETVWALDPSNNEWIGIYDPSTDALLTESLTEILINWSEIKDWAVDWGHHVPTEEDQFIENFFRNISSSGNFIQDIKTLRNFSKSVLSTPIGLPEAKAYVEKYWGHANKRQGGL